MATFPGYIIWGVTLLLLPLKDFFVEATPIYDEHIAAANASSSLLSDPFIETLDDLAVKNLQSYIRIPTVHPYPESGYRQAVLWLHALADEIGLDFRLVDLGPGNLFALIMTWKGSDPTLKSVLFNSHMDVVAVEIEFWTYPPFEAHKDSNGNIFGRGSCDMKSATVATLEAIRRLKQSGFQPMRTIHITVLPDEESGGLRGMKPFVTSKYFADLNVGIDIDEGGVNPNPKSMNIGYAEKSPWQFKITAIGDQAHGSRIPEYTSSQRLQLTIDKLMDFRRKQYLKLQTPGVTSNKITTVNLVRLGGGVAANIIPSKMWAEFDMRISQTDYNFSDIDNMLANIVQEANSLGTRGSIKQNKVSLEFSLKSMETAATVANSSNVWWDVVQEACREINVTCPAVSASPTSDARYVRTAGIPAFGIGPFLNTPLMAHTNNEFINEHEFLRGIDRYQILIRHLTMQPATENQ